MATKTKNLSLTLPSYEDAADVSILNQNFEKLDQSAVIWGLNVTATITEDGVLEFTGVLPTEKEGLTIHFTAPATAADGLQAKFAGSEALYPILSTGEGKEPIQAGTWDVGVPVSLTVSGGSCFFKAAGGVNDTLPAQVGSLKAVSNLVSGKGQVTVSWTNPGSFFAGVLIVKKAGSAPTGVRDGEKIYNGTGTNFVDTELAFDTTYFYRAYPYNTKKQYQTLTNVASVIPMAAKKISELSVGDMVKLQENGVGTLYLTVHQGWPSSLYGPSCNGTWLLRKDILETRQWNSSNSNDYAKSTIHTYLNSTFLNRFNGSIQNSIKQVNIPYRPSSGTDDEVNTGFAGLSCKSFLLSAYELGWTKSNGYIPIDGTKLAYFTAGTDADANTKRIAYLSSSAVKWWLRSPYIKGSAFNASCASVEGSYSFHSCSGSNGIRPAFILPDDFRLKPQVNTDGSYSPLND